MKNLKDAKTGVIVGGSRTRTGTKLDDWNGYQIREGIVYHVMLKNMSVISGLHAKISSTMRALKKGFQVTSE